ncbi:MAG TPA: DNA-formamidopyrimidine glycosylase family protein, partial [Nocardioidaceae bacterium]|nr:DNA-formamidopyrimidine glycosylase family protein [Nocardioidaceae bacterium]
MPEGDTVWRTARHLDQALSGRLLTATDFRVPALATVDLAGLLVTSTEARGKHLLTRIGDAYTLHTHLKMEGSWHLYRPDTAWKRPAHEARVVLTTDELAGVGFSLGITELLDRADEESAVAHLGPDLLGSDWDEDEAIRRLLAEPEVPIA